MGLPPLEDSLSNPETSNPGGLIRGSDLPDDVEKNDNTNPIIGGGQDIEAIDPPELEKRFRDLGVGDPTSVQFRALPEPSLQVGEGQGAPMRVVAEDSEGNRITTIGTGPRGRAESILQRAKQAQQRLSGAANQRQAQDPAASDPQSGLRFGEDAPGLIEQVSGVNPLEFFMEGDGLVQRTIRALQNGEESEVPALEDIPGAPSGENPDPTQNPNINLAELFPDVESEEVSTGAQAAPSSDVTEDDATPSTSTDPASIIGPTENPTGSLQETLNQASEDLAAQAEDRQQQEGAQQQEEEGPSFTEIMQMPAVQKGLGQLAQLFVEPDSGTAQVARQLVKDADQRQQAEQVQQLLSGETSPDEVDSPSVLTTAQGISSDRTREELVKARTRQANAQARLAAIEALRGGASGTNDSGLEQGQVTDTVETVTSQIARRLFSGELDPESQSAFQQLQLINQTTGNLDPVTVRSAAPKDVFSEMVVNRLVAQGMDEDVARARFGSGSDFQQALDEIGQQQESESGGEENDAGVTGLRQDEVDVLREGGTVTFDQPRNINGNEIPAGSYTYQDGQIIPANQ